MRRLPRWPLLAAVVALCSAHVGSPDAWFEGSAGPYRVLVHVQAPGVIPGIATVNVRVDDPDVERVTALANRFDATGGAPPPEIAHSVAEQPGWYRTQLWIMTTGSYSVTATVSGARGTGSVVIPLAAYPLRRLRLSAALGFALGAAGLVLFAGLLTIVGAAVREGVLPPGAQPDRSRRRRARWTMAAYGGVLALVLLGGKRWWSAEDAAFVRSMWKPMASRAAIEDGRLIFAIEDSIWIQRRNVGWLRSRGAPRRPDLIDDHGKVMHLFVVDAQEGRGFAHLHPATTDSVRFTAPMPPLPPGRYAIFADVVQQNGFAQTLVAKLEWTGEPPPTGEPQDADDAWMTRPAPPRDGAGARGGTTVTLEDGSVLRWLRLGRPMRAGDDAPLRFTVEAPDGAGPLEPYMGMAGHAVVVRDDAAVFIHLHPLGTVSPAAQRQFLPRSAAQATSPERLPSPDHSAAPAHPDPLAHALATAAPAADTITFPYAFPAAGSYHIWVQVKRNGRILSGAFRAVVESTIRGKGP
ncbi:MAG: hypothetical protein HY701_06445 [Gemmatimonadetes bacterium]|nr:hypothetical protein [Gemmatimonadota bacterium]